MRKYITLSRRRMADIDCGPDGEDYLARTVYYLARTVYERDDAPHPTGLLDKHGNELFATSPRRPIGFVTRE